MKLAYYSSIPCEPTFGGPLQIYRHFKERDDFEFYDLNPTDPLPWDGWLPRRIVESAAFKRLCRTRIYPWIIYASNHTLLRRQARVLARETKKIKADAIVAVAYGRRCHVCRLAARMAEIPLITIFHDWWPDLVEGLGSSVKAQFDKKFVDLAASSNLILPVTRDLAIALGGHRNAVIIPPIPIVSGTGSDDQSEATIEKPRPLVVYAGNMTGGYGRMLRQLALALGKFNDPPFDLRLFGVAGDWPQKELQELSQAGTYGGVLVAGSDKMRHALQEADFLLVVMDFEPESRRRVQTSFPSKILDYAPFGKPLAVWGPQDCFAVRFTKENELGWVITENNPQNLIAFIASEWNSGQRPVFERNLLRLCQESYSASIIHKKLCNAISSLLHTREHQAGAVD